MKFKVYVDYTTEELPRPFYVGKGNSSRILNLKRNRLHDSIAKKLSESRKGKIPWNKGKKKVTEQEHEVPALITLDT